MDINRFTNDIEIRREFRRQVHEGGITLGYAILIELLHSAEIMMEIIGEELREETKNKE